MRAIKIVAAIYGAFTKTKLILLLEKRVCNQEDFSVDAKV